MVRREVVFPVGVAELWRSLTDPDTVGEWFGATVEWELTPGGRARFRGGEDGDRAGRIEELEPGRRLRFRWWPEDDVPGASEVVYELAAEPAADPATEPDGVRLTMIERPVSDEPVGSTAPEARARPLAVDATWQPWDRRLAGLDAMGCRLLQGCGRS